MHRALMPLHGIKRMMRAVGLLLLPFALLFALSIFTATPAHAQTTTSTNGMFDCLGDYDWGCQVIGYLFEDKGLTGNRMESSSLQGALKVMMAFFSNAILVIASIILLIELIKMVAETAHSGVIGGKETNQIWAPIRLVIAIGLLVPLSNGMNSAQYIVVQIAKWGSGLGSQAWKTFVVALSEQQRLVPPRAPAIKDLLRNTLKIYVCKEMNNYFAEFDVEKIAERETSITTSSDNGLDTTKVTRHFDKPISDGGDFCGSITYIQYSGDNTTTDALKEGNTQTFLAFLPEIENTARTIKDDFLNGNKKYEKIRNTKYLNDLLDKYQAQTNQKIQTLGPQKATDNFKKITEVVKHEASTYGWMSAGTWFLAISRAQGELGDASNTIPTASVNTGILSDPTRAGTHLASFYRQFNEWMDTSPAQYTAKLTENTPSQSGVTESTIRSSNNVDNDTEIMDWVFEAIDTIAHRYGLWQSACKKGMTNLDCKRAWSDINNKMLDFGESTNPFAELADMGHNKIRAAIGFMETALIFSGINVASSLASIIPGFGLIGHYSMALATLFTFLAGATMLAGVMLAFFVPLMPYYRFFFAITNWLGSVVEAIILMPIFALAHLSPRAGGIVGKRASTGYYTVFQILVRPVMTVFGLIVAALIFYAMVRVLNFSYYDAVLSNGYFPGAAGMVARIIYAVLHVVMVYSAANIAFKLIDIIPSRVNRWIGSGIDETKHEDEGTIQSAQSAITGFVSNEVISAPTRIGQQIKPPGLR